MAKAIRNMDELSAALMPVMGGMVDQLAETVYQTLECFLHKYYSSYDPLFYCRSYDFLRSAVKVQSQMIGNKVVASVYIDYDAMDNYKNVSGLQVVKWANEGLHGGQNLGSGTPRVWDDTMNQTADNEILLKRAIHYLQSKGIKVHT